MDLRELIDYVRAHRAGVVSTLGPDGEPQAAYLTLAATDTGELVFDAKPDSRKVANLRRDGRIALVIGGPDGTTLQCQGIADFPAGDELERCTSAYLAAFPEFAPSFDHGSVVVLRVILDWARYGDFRDTPETA
ncbi:pyridoxamine 5'-phosphate oxidase family protein [Amycolatopsis magusensis]|uniref:pyridoxamine 5'-phosphate oxidase family protein n=1 Tax=Amycolatopsis magusensis TaxID=882444 RepID=UPI0037B90C44